MDLYSTREAAKHLGIGLKTLARYIEDGKVPAPKFLKAGKSTFHAWTEEEIENVRKLLPKIANGRKTRYKKQLALSDQESAKTKAQPRAAVPHESRKQNRRKGNSSRRLAREQLAVGNQQSAKIKAPAGVPVPQKARKTRKKK